MGEGTAAGRAPKPADRRFRRRGLDQGDGTRLILGGNGTIEHLAADGTRLEAWPLGDVGWADRAIRFGIRPQGDTVAPRRLDADVTRELP